MAKTLVKVVQTWADETGQITEKTVAYKDGKVLSESEQVRTNAANVASPNEAAYLASVDGFPVAPIPGVPAKEPEVVKRDVASTTPFPSPDLDPLAMPGVGVEGQIVNDPDDPTGTHINTAGTIEQGAVKAASEGAVEDVAVAHKGKLPDSFPAHKTLAEAGINTYGQLSKYADDYTQIVGVGAATAVKIAEAVASPTKE